MRYINSYATSGDVQTAIDNGTLGKPYVAYITSTSGIDWNTLNVSPQSIGEWSNNPTYGAYKLTITDSGSTAWANGVEIATIQNAFINGNAVIPSVKLTYDSGWALRIAAEDISDYDEIDMGQLDESGSSVTFFTRVGVSASMAVSIGISWKIVDNQAQISLIATDPMETLQMNTINPTE